MGDYLAFGYNNGIPEGIETAWGCRAILQVGYPLDIPPDRMDAYGPDKEELMKYLNDNFPLKEMRDAGKVIPSDHSGKEAQEYELFNDGHVIVKANTQQSYGYVYICAYFMEYLEG